MCARPAGERGLEKWAEALGIECLNALGQDAQAQACVVHGRVLGLGSGHRQSPKPWACMRRDRYARAPQASAARGLCPEIKP